MSKQTTSIRPTGRLALRIGTRKVLIGVSSLAEASRMFLTLQWKAIQRGSIVRFATVYDESMTEIARISQNGRVWPPTEWAVGTVALYEPTESDFDVMRGRRTIDATVLS